MKRLKKINVLVNFNIREKLQLLIKPISDLREKRLTHKPVEKWLQNLDALSQQDEKQFNKAFRYFFSTTRKNKADNYKLELKIFLKKMSRNKHPEMYYQDLLELKIILQRIMQEQHLSVSRAKSIRKLILAIDCKTKQLKDNHPPYKANIEPVMNNKKEPAKKIFSQAVTMVQGLKKKLLMNKDTRQESISKITGESLEQEFQQLQSECRSLIHSIQKERVGGDKDKLMTQFMLSSSN